MHDRPEATASETQKSSTVVPVTLSFDIRDQFLHAGITSGALSWTRGRLGMNGDTQAIDAATARSSGGFNRFNLDLARIQSLSDRLDLYGRVSAQWTRHNLDASEKLGLGGVNGVRACPNGEGYGDMGWVVQTEVRYARDAWSVGATVAWRTHGGASLTDDTIHSRSVLANVAYRF